MTGPVYASPPPAHNSLHRSPSAPAQFTLNRSFSARARLLQLASATSDVSKAASPAGKLASPAEKLVVVAAALSGCSSDDDKGTGGNVTPRVQVPPTPLRDNVTPTNAHSPTAGKASPNASRAFQASPSTPTEGVSEVAARTMPPSPKKDGHSLSPHRTPSSGGAGSSGAFRKLNL